jgi:hypothetical protein
MKDRTTAIAAASAAVAANRDVGETAHAEGVYVAECYDAAGNLATAANAAVSYSPRRAEKRPYRAFRRMSHG